MYFTPLLVCMVFEKLDVNLTFAPLHVDSSSFGFFQDFYFSFDFVQFIYDMTRGKFWGTYPAFVPVFGDNLFCFVFSAFSLTLFSLCFSVLKVSFDIVSIS